jgi:hypothetical protein
MLTKGAHTGPALEAKEASDILSWIVAERDARPEIPAIRTMQMPPIVCTMNPCEKNTVDLAGLGVPATLEFEISSLVNDAYMTNIRIVAGPMGLHIAHPLFESWPAGATEPTPDPIDRWFNVDLNLAPAATSPLGTGEGTFVGFKVTDPLSIRFDIFEMQKPM